MGEAAADRRGRRGRLGGGGGGGKGGGGGWGGPGGDGDRPGPRLRRPPPPRPHHPLLEPRLDRGPVPRRAARRPPLRARAPRGLGRRAGDGLRARARRARARAAAHDGGPRERRRRDRDGPRQPGAARRRGRSAGPPPPRLRAVPTGRLQGLAGEYPVWSDQPVRAQDVPGAIDRAYHEAATRRGPALVVVPMDDWLQPADEDREDASPGRVVRAAGVDPAAVDELAAFLEGAAAPALVVGAGADGEEAWAALVELAERLVAPVFQESFAAPRRLPAGPPPLRRLPAGRPAAAAGDARAVRRGARRRGPGLPPVAVRARPIHRGRDRIAVVGDEPDEVHRSPAELAVLAPPAAVARELAQRRPQRDAEPPTPFAAPPRARAARPGRAADREPRARGARGPPPRRRRPRRGGARRPAGAPRALARAPAARLPQRCDGRARVRRAGGGGRADGAPGASGGRGRRRRLVALRDPGPLERRAGAGRRPLRDPLERRLRDHGPPRRAARRRTPLARASPTSRSLRSPRASAARRAGSRPTRSCSLRSTRRCRRPSPRGSRRSSSTS